MNVSKSDAENQRLICLGFDGRKDEMKTEKGNVKEEHIVLVKQPEGVYINHLTPDDGKARSIAEELITTIVDSDSTDSLDALLSDGTAVNAGRLGGVIKLVELFLNILFNGLSASCISMNCHFVTYTKVLMEKQQDRKLSKGQLASFYTRIFVSCKLLSFPK